MNPNYLRLITLAIFGVLLGIWIGRWTAQRQFVAKPQLDVTNQGQTPITVSFNDDESNTFALPPAKKASTRMFPGDRFSVHAGSKNEKSKTFQLGIRDSPLRITAEVNADNPDEMTARYVVQQ
jgi:hypothetical protein